MTSSELKARLTALAKRLNDDMDDQAVSHRLRLLEPGIEQLESVVSGLETKVRSVAVHRSKVKADEQKSIDEAKAAARDARSKAQH